MQISFKLLFMEHLLTLHWPTCHMTKHRFKVWRNKCSLDEKGAEAQLQNHLYTRVRGIIVTLFEISLPQIYYNQL